MFILRVLSDISDNRFNHNGNFHTILQELCDYYIDYKRRYFYILPQKMNMHLHKSDAELFHMSKER